MYRVSQYNIFLPLKNDKFFIVQGIRERYEIVDAWVADILHKNHFVSEDQFNSDQFKVLHNGGFITKWSSEDELNLIKKICYSSDKRAKSEISLTILPTYNCNFRCEYCFERQLQKKSNDWLSHTMSKDMVDAIFERLKQYYAEGVTVGEITLFGGEPLLATNYEIVEYICAAYSVRVGHRIAE